MIDDFTLIDELKLMGYGESDSSGCWIKFQVLPEHMEILRGLKGEIFEVAMKQLDNSHQPVKPGHLCITAVELCKETQFQNFMYEHRPKRVSASDEENAKAGLLECCGISSRKELDHNQQAAGAFAFLRTEFAKWLKAIMRGSGDE